MDEIWHKGGGHFRAGYAFWPVIFLVEEQLYTWPCLSVCVFVRRFYMKYPFLFEYAEYSRIFGKSNIK